MGIIDTQCETVAANESLTGDQIFLQAAETQYNLQQLVHLQIQRLMLWRQQRSIQHLVKVVVVHSYHFIKRLRLGQTANAYEKRAMD